MTFDEGIFQLAKRGLNVFGACALSELPGEIRTVLPSLEGYHSICLFGHGGRTLWRELPKPLDTETHPIDTFVLNQLNWFIRDAGLEALVLYPGTGARLPLQKLGRYLDLARPSLLGMDMHPEFGLWFAYRAVLVSKQPMPAVRGKADRAACETCVEKPCRSACPAGAVRESFQLNPCVNYRLSENSKCLDRCLARLSCPAGLQHQYDLAQLQYHMLRPAHLRKLAEYK